MSLRYRQHLTAGRLLQLTVTHRPTTMAIELHLPDGTLAVSGDASVGGTPTAPFGPALERPRRERLEATPEGLAGRDLGAIEFDFDGERDLAFLTRLDPDDPFRRLRVAHPAWLAGGVNALIAQSVAIPPQRWKHAGTEVRSLRPIPPGARIRLVGRVDRLFGGGSQRFADIAAVALADGSPAMTFVCTTVYG